MSQLILQPFFRFSYVTSSSLTSPGEPSMVYINTFSFLSFCQQCTEISESLSCFNLQDSRGWLRVADHGLKTRYVDCILSSHAVVFFFFFHSCLIIPMHSWPSSYTAGYYDPLGNLFIKNAPVMRLVRTRIGCPNSTHLLKFRLNKFLFILY